jgi:hypothetical protein
MVEHCARKSAFRAGRCCFPGHIQGCMQMRVVVRLTIRMLEATKRMGKSGSKIRVVGQSYGRLAAGRGCSWLHHELFPSPPVPVDAIATVACARQTSRLVTAVPLSRLSPKTSQRPPHHFSTHPVPLATLNPRPLLPLPYNTPHHYTPWHQGRRSFSRYYSFAQDSSSATNVEQVIILGDSGVGKTSLMNQYVPHPHPRWHYASMLRAHSDPI